MDKSNFEIELLNLGGRIKQLRKHRKLTLLDLEILSGINDSDISRYERGLENIEFYTIYKLAMALEVNVYHLTDYEGKLPDKNNFNGYSLIQKAKLKTINNSKK